MTSEIVELRRYLLHPGRRDELIELFDRELVETQGLRPPSRVAAPRHPRRRLVRDRTRAALPR